jgi:hypothetical protein
MSEQDKQTDTEYSADADNSQSSDSLTDDTSTTGKTDIDSELDGEESDSDLDIDKELSDDTSDDDKVSVAKEQRQKQVTAWKKKFESGEVKKEDLPKWVAAEIDYEAEEPDIDARIDAKVAEKLKLTQDSQKYEGLKTQLKSLKLTASQTTKLIDRFKGLKSKLPKGDALEIAIEAAGVKLTTRKAPAGSGVIKHSTQNPDGGIPSDKDWKDIRKSHSEEERRKHLIGQLSQ